MQKMTKDTPLISRRVPKQKRSIEKVERILDCTAILMNELGVDNVNTHLVAAKAGISIGSLYQFFPNIETVKLALVERVMNQLYSTVMQTLKDEPVYNLVAISERLIDATLNFYHHHQDVVKTIVASRNSEIYQQVNSALNERIIEGIVGFIVNHTPQADDLTLRRKTRVAVLVSDVMTNLVWTANNKQEQEAYITEWKILSRSYAASV